MFTSSVCTQLEIVTHRPFKEVEDKESGYLTPYIHFSLKMCEDICHNLFVIFLNNYGCLHGGLCCQVY